MALDRISWRLATNGSTNGATNGSTNGLANGSTNGSTNGLSVEPDDAQLEGEQHGYRVDAPPRTRVVVGDTRPAPDPRNEPLGMTDNEFSGTGDERPELHHYLGVLRRRLGIVVLVPLLTVGVALGLAMTSTRVYSASADVLLEGAAQESVFSTGAGTQSDPARQVDTQIQVLQSNPIERAVNKRLGATAAQVSSVAVAGVGQTDVIRITAQSASPTVARRTANLYASTYISSRTTQAVDELVAAGTALEKKLTDVQAQIDRAGSAGERDALTAQYQVLKDKLDQVQIDASLGRSGASVVAPATTPTSPTSPQPLRDALLALVLGLLLGIGLAFLLEYLDDKTHTADDVARYGRGLTVLAEIPTVSGWRDHKRAQVVALDDPTSLTTESYRGLRTSLQIIALRRAVQTILVTSPMAAEGKTTTAANLAVTMARAGRRVALVDLDLRRPRLERFFGLENLVGVTSVLVGDVPLDHALHQVEVAEGVPPLQVLGSGPVPSNPSEVLGAGQITELLAAVESLADLVIIDAPPLLPVTDALVLSNRVDGVLLVVAADQTRRRHLGRAVDLLRRAEAPVFGAVLNNASRDRRSGYGYNYSQLDDGQDRAHTSRRARRSAGAGSDAPGRRGE